MPIFTIEIEKIELEEGIDSYTRGHITIQGEHGIISSQKMINNQSMIIFISISDLLDGIRIFLINQSQRIYHFVGVGCSFQFLLVKETSNKFRLTNLKSEIIDEMTRLQLIESVWQEVKAFMFKYGDSIDEDEIIKNDLTDSIKEFEKQFNFRDKIPGG
ncbi:MAG: hypothetical protein WBA07_16455 [Rivularia sp. (in: cyanobacteria)]